MLYEFNIKISINAADSVKAKELLTFGLKSLDCKILELENIAQVRSSQQNKAIHLWFTQLAQALNEAGFDMRKTISPMVDISWTDYTVKEYLWRPVQKSLYGTKSTRQLKRHEIDLIFDNINRIIGKRTGVYVEFPSIQSYEKQQISKL